MEQYPHILPAGRKVRLFSFPNYALKIVATVLPKERKNSPLTRSFHFSLQVSFVLSACVVLLTILPLCQFLWLSPPPFIYFIPLPQVHVTVPLLEATQSH